MICLTCVLSPSKTAFLCTLCDLSFKSLVKTGRKHLLIFSFPANSQLPIRLPFWITHWSLNFHFMPGALSLLVLQDCQNLFASLTHLLLQNSPGLLFLLLCIPFTAQPFAQASAVTEESMWTRESQLHDAYISERNRHSFLNQWGFKHQKSVSLLVFLKF